MEEHQTKIPGTHMAIASEILAFGYPANKKEPIEKKKFEDITFYNVYII